MMPGRCQLQMGLSTIDLIVTSPPYANALDNMRAHKFSLVWLGKSIGNLSEMRAEYIGSERVLGTQFARLPERPARIVRDLAQRDKSKSEILSKYFTDSTVVIWGSHIWSHGNRASLFGK